MKTLMLFLSLFVPFFAHAQGIYSDETVVICDVPLRDWKRVWESGYLNINSDSKDPFIHCARPSQFYYVMNKYFKGGTWVVLVTYAERVQHILRYENNYPHLYGSLDLREVVHTMEVSPDENGHYSLPAIFAGND